MKSHMSHQNWSKVSIDGFRTTESGDAQAQKMSLTSDSVQLAEIGKEGETFALQ